jgi:transcriptional regulator with XRE-family HTH domain
MDVIRAMIDARIEQNLTQKELASGLGMQLKIEFVPMQVSRK